jgi:hypothetical protein
MFPVVLALAEKKWNGKDKTQPCPGGRVGYLSNTNQALNRESIVFAVVASLLACNSAAVLLIPGGIMDMVGSAW